MVSAMVKSSTITSDRDEFKSLCMHLQSVDTGITYGKYGVSKSTLTYAWLHFEKRTGDRDRRYAWRRAKQQ